MDYEEDFEDEADEDEEEYKPSAYSASPSPSPLPEAYSKNIVRPESMQGMRPARVPSPSVQMGGDSNLEDIRKAMDAEKKSAHMRANSAKNPDDSKGSRGFLDGYKSSMQKFNLAGGSPRSKAAMQRIKDLRKLKVFDKRTVEKIDLYQQRPQTQINLFLSGKSTRYCNLRTTGCQTGEDDQEVGVNTDEVFNDDKEMQFPTLTMSAAKAEGEPSQMLAFLRRTLPLFESSMGEGARNLGPAGLQVNAAADHNQGVQ